MMKCKHVKRFYKQRKFIIQVSVCAIIVCSIIALFAGFSTRSFADDKDANNVQANQDSAALNVDQSLDTNGATSDTTDENEAVCKDDKGVSYDSVYDAISNTTGSTITLIANSNETSPLRIIKGKNLQIDLNNFQIEANFTSTTDSDAIFTICNGATLTIADNSTHKGGTVYASSKETHCAVKLTSSDSTTWLDGNAELVLNNGCVHGYYYGISGNDTADKGATSCVINNGTVMSDHRVGIYHPQNGELDIKGGKVSGPTAVWVKSGTVKVSGGDIEATLGTATDYVHVDHGVEPTGDTFVVEACDYPDQSCNVQIEAGDFTGVDGEPVASYLQPDSKKHNKRYVDLVTEDSKATFDYPFDSDLCKGIKGPVKSEDEDLYHIGDAMPTPVVKVDEKSGVVTLTNLSDYDPKKYEMIDFVIDVPGAEEDDLSIDDKGIINIPSKYSGKQCRIKALPIPYKFAASKHCDLDLTNVEIKVCRGNDGKEYASVYDAIDASNTYIEMIHDSFESRPIQIGSLVDVEIVLNKYKIETEYIDEAKTTEADGDALFVVHHGSTLTIDDPNVGTQESAGSIIADKEDFPNTAIKMTTNNETKEEKSSGKPASFILKAGQINGYSYGIAGSESEGRDNTNVLIEDNNKAFVHTESDNGVAIFQPQNGVLTINGGFFGGSTAIWAKSGNVQISGGFISGEGDHSDYEHAHEGVNPTGDALVLEACDYPGNQVTANITGGYFTSLNSNPIASYVQPEQSTTKKCINFVHKGTASNKSITVDLCETNFISVQNSDGTYFVKEILPTPVIGNIDKQYNTAEITNFKDFDDIEGIMFNISTEGESPVTLTVDDGGKFSVPNAFCGKICKVVADVDVDNKDWTTSWESDPVDFSQLQPISPSPEYDGGSQNSANAQTGDFSILYIAILISLICASSAIVIYRVRKND